MAHYVYLCGTCGEEMDRNFPIGTARRQTRCACGGVMRLRIGLGVNVSATALETKGVDVRAVDEREARWGKDMPAYKRMRHRGMQPPTIDGAAFLEEHAADQFDVAHQNLYKLGVTRERVVEGAEQAQQIVAEGVPI